MSMELIETRSVSASTVTISNLPQTFTDLYIVMYIKSSGGGTDRALNMDINSDTGSNYSYHRHSVVTTSSASAYGIGGTWPNQIAYIPDGGSAASGAYGAVILHIPNYRTNLTKRHYSETIAETNISSAQFTRYTSRWNNTAAINTLKFWSESNWTMSGIISIYGITSGAGGATVS